MKNRKIIEERNTEEKGKTPSKRFSGLTEREEELSAADTQMINIREMARMAQEGVDVEVSGEWDTSLGKDEKKERLSVFVLTLQIIIDIVVGSWLIGSHSFVLIILESFLHGRHDCDLYHQLIAGFTEKQ